MENPRPEQEKIITNIRILFRQERKAKPIKDYYNPVRVNNFWSNRYIEYENNGDRNKALYVKVNLNRTIPFVKDNINNLKNI